MALEIPRDSPDVVIFSKTPELNLNQNASESYLFAPRTREIRYGHVRDLCGYAYSTSFYREVPIAEVRLKYGSCRSCKRPEVQIRGGVIRRRTPGMCHCLVVTIGVAGLSPPSFESA